MRYAHFAVADEEHGYRDGGQGLGHRHRAVQALGFSTVARSIASSFSMSSVASMAFSTGPHSHLTIGEGRGDGLDGSRGLGLEVGWRR
jgi:hypothetical protein